MLYEQEVLERLGTAAGFDVIIAMPHLQQDLTTIVLDREERTFELDAEDAGELAAVLMRAAERLTHTLAELEAESDDEE